MPEILRLPYLVDPHVHFRTPGQEYKEDFLTGSRAALAGGVIAVMDMPNNSMLASTLELIQQKRELARKTTVCDIGFYLGTMGEADQDIKSCLPYVMGMKIYMNETTGHYVVKDPEKLDNAFRKWESEKPVLVHAEGEVLKTAISLSEKYDRRLYVCHVSEGRQLDWIRKAKDKRPGRVFAEVTPHHLALNSLVSPHPYFRVKPELEPLSEQVKLYEAISDYTIDTVGTDHAPHTIVEKMSATGASGFPGLETTVSILLMAVRSGHMSMHRLPELIHHAPLQILGLPERPNTYIKVERDVPWIIDGAALQTKCHHTPFQSFGVMDKVVEVVREGVTVFKNGEVFAQPGSGLVLPQSKAA